MTAKTQTKSTAKAARKATPITKSTVDTKALHKLVLADRNAVAGIVRYQGAEFEAFKALVLAVPLNDNKALAAVKADIKETFGEMYASSAHIRTTMLSNARMVEHGGTVNKVAVKGRGRAALVAALDGVKSIRELRKALTAAKPESAKDMRGGHNKAEGKAPETKAETKPIDAAKSALAVLTWIMANDSRLKAGTHAADIAKLGEACKILQSLAA